LKIGWKRSVIILAACASVVVLASLAYTFVLRPGPVVYRQARGLAPDQIIAAQAQAGTFSVRKGDVFPFVLQVLYDSTQIGGIDRTNLDQALNLKPFEVRAFRDAEYDLDDRTRVFQRQFDLQLIDGKVGQSYQLATIVVRYQMRQANSFGEKAVVPDPILVAARLPDKIDNLELRPISDMVEDASRDRVAGILLALGGVMVAGGIVHLAWRAARPFRTGKAPAPAGDGHVVAQAYRALHQHSTGESPALVLHQAYHILWLTLNQKAGAGWLQEPSLDRLPAPITPTVTAVLATCEQAYSEDEIGSEQVEETIRKLTQILQFYFGAGEVEAWKS
jgi:hypothetical protein